MTLIEPLVELEHPPISRTIIKTILQRAGQVFRSATSNPEVAPYATVCAIAVPKDSKSPSHVPVKYKVSPITKEEAANTCRNARISIFCMMRDHFLVYK